MTDSRRFEHESYEDTETIKRYLKSIIEGFENGSITLTDGKEELKLKVESLLKLKIKGKQKGPRNKLEFTVSWSNRDSKHKTGEGNIKTGA
ncbi:MAG: amphi-Trp domain-containing protein [Desulfobacteraceae bacterium]|jgi:amphi-Trp domain-containing protein